jgi:hypothetical protein
LQRPLSSAVKHTEKQHGFKPFQYLKYFPQNCSFVVQKKSAATIPNRIERHQKTVVPALCSRSELLLIAVLIMANRGEISNCKHTLTLSTATPKAELNVHNTHGMNTCNHNAF